MALCPVGRAGCSYRHFEWQSHPARDHFPWIPRRAGAPERVRPVLQYSPSDTLRSDHYL